MTNSNTSKKNATIRDVAKKAGVSQATVGRVVGGYGSVSEETRQLVNDAVRELNYIPNAIAQSMKRQSTNTIGVVIGNIENLFFGHMVRAIENYAAEFGYNVIICNTSESLDSEIKALQVLQAKQVDGYIIATSQPSNKKFSASESKLYLGDIPKIFIDREIFGIDEICVKTDHFGGAYEAIDMLMKKGHQDIAVIAGLKVSTMEQRIAGCKKAYEDNNGDLSKLRIGVGDAMSIEDGERITEILLEENPSITAVFALNNLLSMGALKTISKKDLSVPEEISFIGWDDFPLAEIYKPPLTMVTQDTEKIGEVAIKKLLEMISSEEDWRTVFQEKRVTLRTQLIERQSCKILR